ncbi:DMT family transporter [Streptomyces sp. NPDC096176]|uniref:DMT family transporter n=1 Tax=Streptomyces sp. NPDC096176 TaxID=3366079 RepID=UPI00380363E6
MTSIAVPAPALAPRRAWLTDLPVLLVAVVWGASYLAAKGITTAHTVVAVLVLRFALVLPVLVVVGRRRLLALTAAQWRGAGLLGLILSGVFLLETYGVVHTSATNAGLIISLTMIFTPLAEAAMTGRRPSASFVAAAVLSVGGVVLLTQGAGFTAPSFGDFLMLLAAVVRTVHVLVMARTKAVRGADSLSLTTVQLGAAVAVFAALAVLPGGGAAPWAVAVGFGPREWAGLVFLSVFCTLFAFFVQMWAVRRTSPSRVSLLLGTEPLWAAAAGIAIGGEHLGALGLVGAALVLAGTAWGRRAAEIRGCQAPPGKACREGHEVRTPCATTCTT